MYLQVFVVSEEQCSVSKSKFITGVRTGVCIMNRPPLSNGLDLAYLDKVCLSHSELEKLNGRQ